MVLSKKTIFKITAFLLPFVFLILVEIILRIIGYGDNYQLFNKVKIANKPDYLIMNAKVSNKYFKDKTFKSDNQSDLFLETKTDSTFRVFVQGASTVVGFPFYQSGSFPRMLKHRLSETFPNKNIEIINTGITAVNSYTLLDLSDKIIEQKPDLVIIYAGHNEYYGALGVGASNSFGQRPMFIRLYLFLKNFRFFQLLDNSYTKLVAPKNKTPKIGETTLMEVMAKEQRIPLNSKIYQAGLQQFESNLDNLLQKYKKHKIKVILSTVVSNQKDIKPFISDPLTDQANLLETINTNYSLIYKTAQKNGAISYKLGRYYLYKNQDSAKKYLLQAKELDMLRFRAPEKINHTIKHFAKKYGCALVDMESVFLSHSQQGVIGNELLTEHVHPNAYGNFLMADAFYNEIKALKVLKNWNHYISFDEALNDIPLTEIDSIKGKFIIDDLKNSWPYNLKMAGSKPVSTHYEISNPNYEERRAIELYTNQTPWVDVMNQSYNRYKRQGDFAKALKVAQSLILEYPEQAKYYNMAGLMCKNLNNPKKAAYYFLKYQNIKTH